MGLKRKYVTWVTDIVTQKATEMRWKGFLGWCNVYDTMEDRRYISDRCAVLLSKSVTEPACF